MNVRHSLPSAFALMLVLVPRQGLTAPDEPQQLGHATMQRSPSPLASPWWDVALGGAFAVVGVVAAGKASTAASDRKTAEASADAHWAARNAADDDATYWANRALVDYNLAGYAEGRWYTEDKYFGPTSYTLGWYSTWQSYLRASNTDIANQNAAALIVESEDTLARTDMTTVAAKAKDAGTWSGTATMAYAAAGVLVLKGGIVLLTGRGAGSVAAAANRPLRVVAATYPAPRVAVAYDF